MYADFIDASKAFDHVQHERMFRLIRQRSLPTNSTLLIDMERRQCGIIVSEYFGADMLISYNDAQGRLSIKTAKCATE